MCIHTYRGYIIVVVVIVYPPLYITIPPPIYSRYIRVCSPCAPLYIVGRMVCVSIAPYRLRLAVVRGTPSTRVGYYYYIRLDPSLYILCRYRYNRRKVKLCPNTQLTATVTPV